MYRSYSSLPSIIQIYWNYTFWYGQERSAKRNTWSQYQPLYTIDFHGPIHQQWPRSLALSPFTRFVAQLIKFKTDEMADEWHFMAKGQRIPISKSWQLMLTAPAPIIVQWKKRLSEITLNTVRWVRQKQDITSEMKTGGSVFYCKLGSWPSHDNFMSELYYCKPFGQPPCRSLQQSEYFSIKTKTTCVTNCKTKLGPSGRLLYVSLYQSLHSLRRKSSGLFLQGGEEDQIAYECVFLRSHRFNLHYRLPPYI